jgi:nitronate monooxygenase
MQEFDDWTKRIRKVSLYTQIRIQIGTLQEAKRLLRSSERPDVLVVQGSESGGHGRIEDGMGLMTLLPEVADTIADSQIPLLAAGGIADGRGVAAALCLGGSGVVMGTRFLASHEALVNRGYQDAVLLATDRAMSTTRTLLHNHLRGEYGWPEEYSPRMIINKIFTEHQAGHDFGELKRLYNESVNSGNGWGPGGRRATYSGASVSLIQDVRAAVDIVCQVRQHALTRIHILTEKPLLEHL